MIYTAEIKIPKSLRWGIWGYEGKWGFCFNGNIGIVSAI
jgi:hypothetical protein